MRKQGFTLVEMLVVMGIIAVLIGSLIAGFSRMTKTAQKAKAQETVSNAATALAAILTNEGRWPNSIRNNTRMNAQVAKALARRGLMSITYNPNKKVEGGGSTDYTPQGVDKYGILDPWGATVLKRNPNGGAGQSVPSGGTVSDHILYFAVDKDGDGVVTMAEGAPVDVRATAIVWCAGADGKLGAYGTHSKEGSDDIYSWQRGQEQKK